jgi:hypothetical protein
MPDDELLRSLKSLVKNERGNLATILSRLAEVDRRRLALMRGFTSLFDYCVRALRYCEPETAVRIHAARAAASYPLLYPMLASGRLSLTAVSMLAPHLKPDNHRDLIRRALGRSKRELEAMLAPLSPSREVPDRIRILGPATEPAVAAGDGQAGSPGPLFESPMAGVGAPQPPAPQEPAQTKIGPRAAEPVDRGREPHRSDGFRRAPARVRFTFEADEHLLRDIDRAKELLRHRHPRGRLEDVLSDALHALLERIDPERLIRRKAARRRAWPATGIDGRHPREGGGAVVPQVDPRSESGRGRAVPQRIKDEVWLRDGGRCAFRAPDGRRCQARAGLEYDHVRPFSLGGDSGDPAWIRLLCRAHNGLEARRIFGDGAIDAAIHRSRSARRQRPPPGPGSPHCGNV